MEAVTDIQNSEMLIRMMELGKLGEQIAFMISSLKTRRMEYNYKSVAEIAIDIFKNLEKYQNYTKNEE